MTILARRRKLSPAGAKPRARALRDVARGTALAGLVGMTAMYSAAHAQQKPADFPTRPIRILAPIAAGGGLDTITRIGAQTLGEQWGQSAVVDNRPGGGTIIAMDLAARANPDGYTLFSGTNTMMLLSATKRVKYDIRKAFDPVVLMTTQWYVLVINPSVPVRNVKELVAYSKAQPQTFSYGSAGIGTNGHLRNPRRTDCRELPKQRFGSST